MNFFNYILQGSEATLKNAISCAQGLDFSEIEIHEQNIPYLSYKDTINGIEIYYNYGCDSYYFVDATNE